jgi:hypothetical protein
VGTDAGGFFGGIGHPVVEGDADAAALVWIVDYYEANEVAPGEEAGAQGIFAAKHVVQDEGHVVVFEELGYG